VVFDDGTGRAVDAHVLGPVLEAAGQGHPGFGVHLPALRETAAARVDLEAQSFGPRAAEGGGVDRLAGFERGGGEEGAAAEFLRP
jgi:hypothetical protein